MGSNNLARRKREGLTGQLLRVNRVGDFTRVTTVEKILREQGYSIEEQLETLIEIARQSDKPSVKIAAMNAINTRVNKAIDRAIQFEALKRQEQILEQHAQKTREKLASMVSATATVRRVRDESPLPPVSDAEFTPEQSQSPTGQIDSMLSSPPSPIPVCGPAGGASDISPAVPQQDSNTDVIRRKDISDGERTKTTDNRTDNSDAAESACVIVKQPTPDREGGVLHESLRGLAFSRTAVSYVDWLTANPDGGDDGE